MLYWKIEMSTGSGYCITLPDSYLDKAEAEAAIRREPADLQHRMRPALYCSDPRSFWPYRVAE